MTGLRPLLRVLVKAVVLFAAANLLFAAANPLPALGNISAYNHLFPGRERLPYGEQSGLAYNLSLYNLDAMFASHKIAAGPKPAGEYRVILIGDSSVWGFLLKPEDTLAALLGGEGISAAGRQVRFYNLGYPTISLSKDLMMLEYAMRYQPDLIIWPVTLEAMPVERQLSSPIVRHNPQIMRNLIAAYDLQLDPQDPAFVTPGFWDRTIVGERRNLADLARLQIYGFDWAATGVDQYYPADYDRPQRDLQNDSAFHDRMPPSLDLAGLSFDVLDAGRRLAGSVPVLFVNEPIYLSDGANSDIRYNFFYPRWAYDDYRRLLSGWCRDRSAACLDAWDIVPAAEFSNSAIHLTPAGEKILADRVQEAVQEIVYAK